MPASSNRPPALLNRTPWAGSVSTDEREVEVKEHSSTKSTPRPSFKNLFIVLIFVSLIAGATLLANNLGAPARAELGTYTSGQLIILKTATIAGVTKEDYLMLFGFASKNNMEGITQMVAKGKAFSIPTGTKVRVYRKHLSNCEITVMDGALKDKAGWVPLSIFQ